MNQIQAAAFAVILVVSVVPAPQCVKRPVIGALSRLTQL